MKAELMPLADLMRDYRDGDEHGWDTEFEWLRSNHQDRIDALIESAKKKGIQKPILLGSDARVWDGHHRIKFWRRRMTERLGDFFAFLLDISGDIVEALFWW